MASKTMQAGMRFSINGTPNFHDIPKFNLEFASAYHTKSVYFHEYNGLLDMLNKIDSIIFLTRDSIIIIHYMVQVLFLMNHLNIIVGLDLNLHFPAENLVRGHPLHCVFNNVML